MFIKKMILILLLCLSSISAQWFIPAKTFHKKYKFVYPDLAPGILSHRGNFLICHQMLDTQSKWEGYVYAIHIIRFLSGGKVSLKNVRLPIDFLVGIALTNNERDLIVVGNYGTKILKVNLSSLSVKTIYEYKENKAGFKTEALVVGRKGKVFLSGYFYDEEQYSTGSYVVEMKMGAHPKFVEMIDLDKLHKDYDIARSFSLVYGNQAYFSIARKQERKTYLYYYDKGKVTQVDKGALLGAFVGVENRIFYTIRYDQKTRRTFVKDLQAKKTWEIGRDISYTYPFMSRDGKTILTAVMNIMKNSMTVYFAKESQQYKLTKMLDNVPIGPMKISGNGRFFMLNNYKGILVDYIRKPAQKSQGRKK